MLPGTRGLCRGGPQLSESATENQLSFTKFHSHYGKKSHNGKNSLFIVILIFIFIIKIKIF